MTRTEVFLVFVSVFMIIHEKETHGKELRRITTDVSFSRVPELYMKLGRILGLNIGLLYVKLYFLTLPKSRETLSLR